MLGLKLRTDQHRHKLTEMKLLLTAVMRHKLSESKLG